MNNDLETKQIISAWATLSHCGSLEFTMNVPAMPNMDLIKEPGYYNIEECRKHDDKIEQISELIYSMGSFNKKDGDLIYADFADLFNALPTRKYVNGGPRIAHVFDTITFEGDDTIIFQGTEFHDPSEPSKYDLDAVKDIVNRYGRRWKADEATFEVEHNAAFAKDYYRYYIRFWWD